MFAAAFQETKAHDELMASVAQAFVFGTEFGLAISKGIWKLEAHHDR